MTSPRPTPLGLISLVETSFPNSLNRFSLSFSLIPFPVSLTYISVRFGEMLRMQIKIVPFGVNLIAFPTRLMIICFILKGSDLINWLTDESI